MKEELQLALQAVRDEFRRQAEKGVGVYHGVGKDGLDGLEGYFDLERVALAALETTRPPSDRTL
jgi:hypothetical protein